MPSHKEVLFENLRILMHFSVYLPNNLCSGGGDGVSAHEEFRQVDVPLLDHGQSGEAEEDDEDRGDSQRHEFSISDGAVSGRRRGKVVAVVHYTSPESYCFLLALRHYGPE